MDNDKSSYIQSTLQKIRENKRRHAEAKKAIKYNKLKPKTSKLSTPFMQSLYPKVDLAKVDLKDITKDTIHIDKEIVRKDIKKRLRMAWKDPGYASGPFGGNMPLPNRVSGFW
jgi:predicted metal-dependent hydrolase